MLVQKISNKQTTGGTQWVFTDVSGMYQVTDNPTGWGSPNILPSAVTGATITVTPPNTTTQYTFDVLTTVNAITLPSAYVQNYTFNLITLEPSDIALTEFPDGIYTIVYTIDGEEITVKTLLIYHTKCCVNKLLEKALDSYLCGKNCETDKLISDSLKARAMLLQATNWQASCFDLEKANQLLIQASKICKTHKCGCGCS